MPEPLISVQNVSKKYCKDLKKSLWYGLKDLGNEVIGSHDRSGLRQAEFWANHDLNFEVHRGECLGLIGHNGAGKSTLLKMLNGLIRPDMGQIVMKGRVGALIELGAGFNPILTGRENIYNNAAILGLSKAETTRKLPEIIAFSEIGDFIDTPVQYYSSGMRVRLGFAVAAQMEPDILLIDEVLAVGDMGFVLKCFNTMDQLLGRTAMILVSHSMPQIARMSTKIMLLDHGQAVYYGNDVSQGITRYYEMFGDEIGNFQGTDDVHLDAVTLTSGSSVSVPGQPFTVKYGEDLSIEAVIEFKRPVQSPSLYLAFYDKEQRNFAEVSNFTDQLQTGTVNGKMVFRARIPAIPFAQGKYSITIALAENSANSRETLFRYQSAVYFNVDGRYHGWAPIQLDPQWEIIAR